MNENINSAANKPIHDSLTRTPNHFTRTPILIIPVIASDVQYAKYEAVTEFFPSDERNGSRGQLSSVIKFTASILG